MEKRARTLEQNEMNSLCQSFAVILILLDNSTNLPDSKLSSVVYDFPDHPTCLF